MAEENNKFGRALCAWTIIVPIVLAISVWVPVLSHFYVRIQEPPRALISKLRTAPNNEAFEHAAIVQSFFGSPLPRNVVSTEGVERLIKREATSARLGEYRSEDGLTEEAFLVGLGSLEFASFVIPDIYVRAFEKTGRPEFLEYASRFIVDFSKHERSRWLPVGFLWNDHAIAARVGVLARFWREYRNSTLFRDAVAAEVIRHAMRCAAFLEDPDHFTFWTNHGVMQNLALLQYTAAFPALPGASTYRDTAMERLTLQFRYYVDEEGVVLEHSAGYHAAGVRFLDMAIRLSVLNGLPVPPEWRERYDKAHAFLSLLVHPDGSLPMYGDTSSEPLDMAFYQPETVARDQLRLFPVSGYAIWRDYTAGAVISQTTTTWSHFPEHGHKVADELSTLMWARGRPWITNTGYWPYDSKWRSAAVGWHGGNAPHWQNERFAQERQTTLLGLVADSTVRLLDLERVSESRGIHRRQIISLGGSVWIVFDNAQSESVDDVSETLWTFWPDLSLTRANERTTLASPDNETVLSVMIVGGSETSVTSLRGSYEPFAGWVVTSEEPRPAPALLVQRRGAQSWSATVFSLNREEDGSASFNMQGAEQWVAAGVNDGERWRVQRAGKSIRASVGDDARELSILPAPDVRESRAEIRQAFEEAAKLYSPRYRNIDLYRWRFTIAALFALLLQEIALFGVRRFLRGDAIRWRLLSLCGWAIFAVWGHLIYLA